MRHYAASVADPRGRQSAGPGRDDARSSLPPRDADPAAGDVRASCRTAGAGTPRRRQVTPVVMTTGRAVSVPPSKSRSRQEYAAVRRTHVHRDDIHEAFLTLGCAIICWRRLRNPLTCQDR